MRPEPSETTKRNVTSMLFSKKAKAVVSASFTSPEQVLGEIYELMVKMDEQKKLEEEQKKSDEWDRQDALERRNQELIKALTGRKKPKKKVVEEKKKEIVKDVEKKGKKVEKETQTEATTAPKETGKATKEVTTTSKEPPKVTKETTTPKETPKQVAEKPPEVKPTPEVGPTPGLPRARVRAGTKEPTAPVTPPPAKVAPVKPSATKIGAIGVLGAAGISIAGETSAKTVDEAIRKGGQIVPNDPESGSYSYGIFGMNSKAKTVDNFVAQYPHLGITGKSGTKEFNELWEKVAREKPNELFDAQMDWYNKSVLAPIRKDLTTVLSENIAKDERTVAYFADRRIQYGKVMENAALKATADSKTTEEFIDRMTKFDLDNIGTAFKTYLADPRHKGHEVGLRKRIERRKELALKIENNIGSKINSTSTENKNLKSDLDKSTRQTYNNTNVTVQKSQQTSQPKVEDDRPIIIKKAQQ